MSDRLSDQLNTTALDVRRPSRSGGATVSEPVVGVPVHRRSIRRLREWFGRLILVGFAIVTVHMGAIWAAQPQHGANVGTKTVRVHHIVISIDTDDEKRMGHAIAYPVNLARGYQARGERFEIEIVANGSGIKLYRADTSPLQQPLAAIRASLPGITYSVCASSKAIAEQKEGHAIPLIDGARLVPFGIGRVVDLEEAGWAYIHG